MGLIYSVGFSLSKSASYLKAWPFLIPRATKTGPSCKPGWSPADDG